MTQNSVVPIGSTATLKFGDKTYEAEGDGDATVITLCTGMANQHFEEIMRFSGANNLAEALGKLFHLKDSTMVIHSA